METFAAPVASLPATEPPAPSQFSFHVSAPLQQGSANGHTSIRAGRWISSDHAMDSLQCTMAGQLQASTAGQAYTQSRKLSNNIVKKGRAEIKFTKYTKL